MQGLVRYEFISEGNTVNEEIYIEVLRWLDGNVQKNGLETARLFCMTTRLHISWWSNSTLPGTI
jgi:hypothetical protein